MELLLESKNYIIMQGLCSSVKMARFPMGVGVRIPTPAPESSFLPVQTLGSSGGGLSH